MTDASWDSRCRTHGHTGWSDAAMYAYDQPVRIAAVRRAIAAAFPEGLVGRTVLDVGCGTGDFVALAADLGARVTGIDISAEVIAGTTRRFANSPLVDVRCASIVESTLPDASVDLVTSVTVLQHIVSDEDLVRTLQSLRRAMRPDGYLLALDLAPAHAATRRDAHMPVVERPVQVWHALYARAGFRVASEAAYPQWGGALLRGFSRVLGALARLRRRGESQAPPGQSGPGPAPTPGRLGRLVTRCRRLLLGLARPVDHRIGLGMPRKLRYYRLFVLRPVGE